MITKDEYEQLLNESYAEVKLMTGVAYQFGTVVRRVDPIHFDLMYNDWCDYLEHEGELA